MRAKKKTRLWEVDHSYYCNQASYWGHDVKSEHASWADFIEEEGDADPDYNLLFRWDWLKIDKDEERYDEQLLLCWMTQRKGYYRFSLVHVSRDDEPEIRTWLRPRFAHLLELWEPLTASECE